MCFSAEADVVAGAVIIAVGVDAFRHVRTPTEKAVAALPVVLGVHQLIESFVWLGLDDRVPHALERISLWIYLAIAYGVLPVLVPFAVRALEPASRVRRFRVFTVLGVGVAAVLMFAVVRGPVEAHIEGRHISYVVNLWYGGVIVALYVVATCGSMMSSSHRHVRWFGAANLAAAGVLAWLDKTAFISLWCLWAAVTGAAIAAHLRHAERPRAATAS